MAGDQNSFLSFDAALTYNAASARDVPDKRGGSRPTFLPAVPEKLQQAPHIHRRSRFVQSAPKLYRSTVPRDCSPALLLSGYAEMSAPSHR